MNEALTTPDATDAALNEAEERLRAALTTLFTQISDEVNALTERVNVLEQRIGAHAPKG